jgi:hypothetical protein
MLSRKRAYMMSFAFCFAFGRAGRILTRNTYHSRLDKVMYEEEAALDEDLYHNNDGGKHKAFSSCIAGKTS